MKFRLRREKNTVSIRAEDDTGRTLSTKQLMNAPAELAVAASRLAVCVERENPQETDPPAILERVHTYSELQVVSALKDTSAVIGARFLEKTPLEFSFEGESVVAHAKLGRTRVRVDGTQAGVFGQDPAFVFADQETLLIAEIDLDAPPVLKHIIDHTQTPIPRSFSKTLFDTVFHDADGLGRVYLSHASIIEPLATAPTTRLYIIERGASFVCELRFVYKDTEIPFGFEGERYIFANAMLVRITRDFAEEQRRYEQLLSHGLLEEKGVFIPENDPVSWLAETARALISDGVEVFGREALLGRRVRDQQARMSVSVSTERDWLDLRVSAQVEDYDIPVRHLVHALIERERFVQLSDGSLGAIPREWIDKLSEVIGVLEVTDTGFRAQPAQVAVVEEVVSVASEHDASVQYEDLRKRFARGPLPLERAQPEGFAGQLRPYQHKGFEWMTHLRSLGVGGLLADDMGLGKTCQVLCCLQDAREHGSTKPFLVVVPTSLVYNWKKEAEKFTPDRKVYVHHGDGRASTAEELRTKDVIITTYNTLRNDIAVFATVPLGYAVLDESQYIKNPHSQVSRAVRQLVADHRIAATGTPIENSSLELWSQFAFTNPGLLGGQAYFTRTFARRIEERGDAERAEALKLLVAPFILRRTKESVAKDLPEKQISVVYCDLEDEQETLYNAVKAYVKEDVEEIMEQEGMGGAQVKILQGLLRLRQLANHPLLVDKNYLGRSGKFDALLDRLFEAVAEGHKALVFSTFIGTLSLLQQELSARGIRYAYLDGQTGDRQAQVELFQEDEGVSVFLISLKAGGVGLTLTAADYVFIADPWWNPAVERQAIDRAHRIGQTKPVLVYKLISRGTVEEKILALQEQKTALSEAVIQEDGFFKTLSPDDVRSLLE